MSSLVVLVIKHLRGFVVHRNDSQEEKPVPCGRLQNQTLPHYQLRLNKMEVKKRKVSVS